MFEVAEVKLAGRGEDMRYRAVGAAFDLVVEVNESPSEAVGERPPDGRFARTHVSDECHRGIHSPPVRRRRFHLALRPHADGKQKSRTRARRPIGGIPDDEVCIRHESCGAGDTGDALRISIRDAPIALSPAEKRGNSSQRKVLRKLRSSGRNHPARGMARWKKAVRRFVSEEVPSKGLFAEGSVSVRPRRDGGPWRRRSSARVRRHPRPSSPKASRFEARG